MSNEISRREFLKRAGATILGTIIVSSFLFPEGVEAGEGAPPLHIFGWRILPGDTIWEISQETRIEPEQIYDALERLSGHRNPKHLPTNRELQIHGRPMKSRWAQVEFPGFSSIPGGRLTTSITPLFFEHQPADGTYQSPPPPFDAYCPPDGRIVYIHRGTSSGRTLAAREVGEEISLCRDWNFDRRTRFEVIPGPDGQPNRIVNQANEAEFLRQFYAQESRRLAVPAVPAQASLPPFRVAFLTCHPDNNPDHPQRLIVIAEEVQ